VGVLAVLLAAAVAEAGRVTKPILAKMQGHTGPARTDDRKIADLTLRHGKQVIEFTLEEIWVLSGDAAGTDIVHEVEQYKPSMTLSGPAEMLDRLLNASPGQRLDVVGYYRRGQRMFMLSSVEPAKTKPS
jgi:hypothetical protein